MAKVKAKAKVIEGRSRLIVRPGDKCLPLGADDLSVDAMRSSVVGLTGQSYHGFPVVRIKPEAGVYGRSGKRGGDQWRTLHHGLINHAELEQEPTASWAVMAAMFELGTGGKTFSKAEVLDRARHYCGSHGHGMSTPILNAWNILKTHHVHPTKCLMGYSYMVMEEDGRMWVRPRLAGETAQHCLGRRLAEKETRKALMAGVLKPSSAGVVTERVPTAERVGA
jgi:hypothetical protein